jgi:excisionase family DNA binding protein
MENPFEIILEKLNKIEEELAIIKANQENTGKEMKIEFLTIKELSEYLKLTVPTIYGYTSTNRIPHIKRGKRLYFKKSDIDIWIEKGQRKTVDEMVANYFSNKKKF